MTTTADLDQLATEIDAEGNEVAAQAANAATDEGESNGRGQKISAARRAKLDALFAGKKYEIVKEVDLTQDPQGRKFETPLGNQGRKGWAIKLVEGYEPSVDPGSKTGELFPTKMIFGESVLRDEAEKTYGAITMPEKAPARVRRSKEQKQAEEAEKRRAKQEAMDALAAELGI
jgi:hypothetical protein